MLKSSRHLLRAVVFGAILTSLFFVFRLQAAGKTERFAEEQLSGISLKVQRILVKNHYRRLPLSPEVARSHIDFYIKALDGERSFFTEEDIAGFDLDPQKLYDALRKGDNSLAFQIYARYRARYRAYREFAVKMLQSKIDFSKDEELVTDRSKLPWCKNDAELHELWRKRIKNEVIFYRLFNRALKESTDPEDRKSMEDAARWNAGTPESKVMKRLRDVSNAVEKREKIDILGIYLDALTHVYGPHSNYMPPKAAKDFDINMSLSLTGIGATLTTDNGFIKIVSLVPGGPAARDGRLKVNDRIVAVTQENGATTDLIDMPVEEAVQYIRGKEKTKVTLSVLPGDKGRSAVPVRITLTRAKILLTESEAHGKILTLKGKKVGIITLPSFYMDFDGAMRGDANFKRCSEDVRRILADFRKKGVQTVVMDLRRNGGGSLAEAVSLTGLFIPTGPVVQRRDSKRNVTLAVDDDSAVEWSGPLVVMISKLSASAAEIFTAALRDCDRAVVVGDSRTFGKGTVLQVERLQEGFSLFGQGRRDVGSMTFEIEMFYRITGSSVQQLGIRSDVQIPSVSEAMKVGELYMDNHLPWDNIDPVSRARFIPHLEEKIAVLKKNSAARIAASPEFRSLERRIKVYRDHRKKNSVSLNEEKRWKDYQQEKQIADAEEKELGLKDDKKKDVPDIGLREAAAIAVDLYTLTQEN
ncbi:MAG: carboxy terminal-processing peptidase [Lentisphaeria bacterium]|nr:carboxy terminal-processing peptidase [Lentisphaeria bacterium]